MAGALFDPYFYSHAAVRCHRFPGSGRVYLQIQRIAKGGRICADRDAAQLCYCSNSGTGCGNTNT